MAKPPKKIPVTAAAETTVTTRPAQSGSGSRVTANLPDTLTSGVDSTTGSQPPGTSTNRPPAVIVNEIPDTYRAARSAIAWPQDRLHELTPHGENTGLFTGPDQRTYAQIGSEGRFIVERDLQGNYYVPLTFAPGVPGPVLTKIEGQASWHIQRPGWQSTQSRSGTPATPQTLSYLAPDDAQTLTRAELSSGGIRYNKLKHTFVDTAEGTVMVRKNQQGDYQLTSATSRDLPEVFFEQIPGTVLWRLKKPDSPSTERPAEDRSRPIADADQAQPGPSKRARVDEPEDPVPPTSLDTSVPADQTPFFWLPWGHLNKPPVVESVQLGWFHYPIVPIGSNRNPKVYFVRHPDFAPAGFDAFEQMLRMAPLLQPVATFRIGNDPGEINPGKRFFDEPISQSVANAFPDFSDTTAYTVARKLFELADNSPKITGTGLINIQAVLHQWRQRPFGTAPAYADPLNMLSVAPSIDINGKKLIRMPSQVDGELQRLTFDPQRFPIEWNHYTTYPTDLNLRRLLGALLVRGGYDVFPLTHEHRMPTLVFRRESHDPIYFMKLGAVEHVGLSHTPGNELAEPSLPARIGKEAFVALTTANAQNKVVWLIGGVLKVESTPDSVFIIRER
ncbi:hypothetical protein [Pseudomonas fluorescens]|uniref:Uncharacterized protein n=1 Tax=Pseudomonas fluorescens TaxID=294 RepID=A0A5E6QJ14_PSEFL|nr:hypothetical protein [Pseudomonas fluorescens]VVM56306.1 hypothetical protein PS655_01046 [Pseudomonas fluorescens]